MRIVLLALFSVAGCGTVTGLPSGGDGGPDNDGSVAADLKGVSCGEVAASVSAWFDSHRSCQVDGDCTFVGTGCGLPGACGDYINNGGSGPYLRSLVMSWNDNHCGVACLCPNGPPAAPGCNNGVCGAKMFRLGSVGDPCVNGPDCQSGQCLTQNNTKIYLGGYCTILDCDKLDGATCPTGSECKPGGDGSGRFYCLKNCNPTLNMLQCRDGFACCSGPGPTGSKGWCAPTSSSLCLAG